MPRFASGLLEALNILARGEVRQIACSELFYPKACIGSRFLHGKQQGKALTELVPRGLTC
jgi:hypothetical protein